MSGFIYMRNYVGNNSDATNELKIYDDSNKRLCSETNSDKTFENVTFAVQILDIFKIAAFLGKKLCFL